MFSCVLPVTHLSSSNRRRGTAPTPALSAHSRTDATATAPAQTASTSDQFGSSSRTTSRKRGFSSARRGALTPPVPVVHPPPTFPRR